MESFDKVLDAIATLEKFLNQNQELVNKSRAALKLANSNSDTTNMLKVRHDRLNWTVGHLLLPKAIVGTLQECRIFSTSDLVEFCNVNGIPGLRKLPRVGNKAYLELLEALSNICEGDRDFKKEFSYRV